MVKKIALVIGNSSYLSEGIENLKNAVVDAKTIAENLESRGFEVDFRQDLNAQMMEDALTSFHNKIDESTSLAVFYYAGHGCEQHGLMYLHPIDLPNIQPSVIQQYGIPSSMILGSTPKTTIPRIFILDCCRINERNWSTDERARFEDLADSCGHRPVSLHSNTLIAYSTSSGESADDGDGHNGPYCRALSPLLLKHRLSVEDVFKEVAMLVSNASGGRQRPWFYWVSVIRD